ncbi:MICOS complex subunit MIC27 isoform X1 [Pogona vitticeps]
MAAKVAKWAATPIALASANASASSKEQSQSPQVKTHQLPIYNAPPLNSKYIEEEPGRLQTGISVVRKTTSHYINGFKDAYLFVKNGIISSIQFGKDAYVYLKNPPPEFLPKVGVITVSGLTGLVLARKGSKFKKIAYPLGLGTLGVCVCYPAQSVLIAKVTGGKVYAVSHATYEAAGSLWRKKSPAEMPHAQKRDAQLQEDSSPGLKTQQSISEASEATHASQGKAEALEMQFRAARTFGQKDSISLTPGEKAPSLRTDVSKPSKFKPDPSLMDYGQSSPEDKDMYSMRS